MRYQDSRIFVGNFAADKVPPSELEALFAQYGRLVESPVIRRRFAFVQFDNPESAQQAIREATGTVLGGLPIDCKLADDREPRYKSKSERLASRGRGRGRGRGRDESWGGDRPPYERGPPPPTTDYDYNRPPPSSSSSYHSHSYDPDPYRRGGPPPADAYAYDPRDRSDRASRSSSYAPYSLDQARDRRAPPPHTMPYGRAPSPPRLAPGEAYPLHTGDPRHSGPPPSSSRPVQCLLAFSSTYGESIAKRTREMFAMERVDTEEKYIPGEMGVESLIYEAFTRNIRAILFVNETNPTLYGLHIILPVDQATTYCDIPFSEALYRIRGDSGPSRSMPSSAMPHAHSSAPPPSSHSGGYGHASHPYPSAGPTSNDPRRATSHPPPTDSSAGYPHASAAPASHRPPPNNPPPASGSYGRDYPPPASAPYDPASVGTSSHSPPAQSQVDTHQLANLLRLLQPQGSSNASPTLPSNSSYGSSYPSSTAPPTSAPSNSTPQDSLQSLLGTLNRSRGETRDPPSSSGPRDPRASSSTIDLVAKQLSLQRDAKPSHSDPRLR